MGLPKKRRSHTRQGIRRSHHALKKISLASCTHCAEPILPHRICPHCGYYKGKLVVPVED